MRSVFTIIFFFTFTFYYSQDVIIKKNGERINCRIVEADSLNLHYTTFNGSMPYQVRRDEVEKYFVSRNSKLAVDPMAANSIAVNEKVTDETDEKTKDILLISVQAGIASPVGDFASKDVLDIKSGLADRGRLFQANITLKVHKFAGLTLAYRYQWHNFDHGVINDYYSSLNPGVVFTTVSTPWIIKGFLGGLYLNFPVKMVKGLSFHGDVLLGMPGYELPARETMGTRGGFAVTESQYTADAQAFTFVGGIGMQYKLGRSLAVNASLNYLNGEPSFMNILIRLSTGEFAYFNYNQKVTTVNFQAGITYILTGKR